MFCKNCGKEIEDGASFCPGCGKSVNPEKTEVVKPKKKKHPILITFVVMFALIIIIAIIGSSGDDPQKVGENVSNETVSDTQVENNIFGVGDIVSLNDINVTLVNVSENNGENYITPEDGKVFVVCEFEIENNSDKDIAVSSMLSFEAYIDDYSTNMSLSAMLSTEKSQLDGTVAAGKKMNGVIGYEADADWETIEVRFTPDFWVGKDITFTYKK